MCCFLLIEVVDLDFCFLILTIPQLLIISLYAFDVILCHWKPGANQCILVLHSVCKTPCMVDKSIHLIIWSSFSLVPYGAALTVLVLSNNCCYGSILTAYVYMYTLWIVQCCDCNGIKLCCQILLQQTWKFFCVFLKEICCFEMLVFDCKFLPKMLLIIWFNIILTCL